MDYATWIVLSFVLSWASYHGVEQVFRKQQNISNARFYMLGIPIILLVLAFASKVPAYEGFPDRFTALQTYYGPAEMDNKILQAEVKQYRFSKPYQNYIKKIYAKDRSDKPHVLIVGDSHGRDLFNAFWLNRGLYEGEHTFEVYIHHGEADETPEFLDSDNLKKADIVILSFRYTHKKELRNNHLSALISELKLRDKTILVCGTNMEFPRQANKELFDTVISEYAQKEEFIKPHTINKYFFNRRNKSIEKINSNIQQICLSHQVPYLDKVSLICDDQTCKGSTPKGQKTYYDPSHWTVDGARFFGKKIKKKKWLLNN